jgi:hypothetical protein
MPLTETVASLGIGGPLRSVDVAFNVQRANISDGNRRATVQLAARYPLPSHLALLFAGTGIWFEERSPLYWDPRSYIAGATGLELAIRQPRGLSFGSRLLAGPARSIADEVETSLQISGGVDVGYRTEVRDFGAAVTYGSGRAGEYRRFEASMYVTLLR